MLRFTKNKALASALFASTKPASCSRLVGVSLDELPVTCINKPASSTDRWFSCSAAAASTKHTTNVPPIAQALDEVTRAKSRKVFGGKSPHLPRTLSDGKTDVHITWTPPRVVHGQGVHLNVALNKSMISCLDAGNSLLTIVAKDGPKMNSINVATAWHRLAKLSKRKEIPSGGRQLLEDVRMEILERLTEKFADDFDAMNLSNVVWSCGALNYHPTGSVLPRLCDNLIAKAEMGLSRPRYPASETKAFPSAQALSNCLWALATLRSMHALKFAKLVAKVTPKLTDQFNPALAGVGGAFVTQTIANQLWSYATLREHPGDELMDKFAAMVTEHVHHFKSQELSNIIWSYSALSHYPGDDFMRVVEMELGDRSPFDPQCLARNIMSVATFHHSDNAARAGLHSFMCSLEEEAALELVNEFNLQSLSNSIWGVSVMGGFSLKFYRRLWERCASEVNFTDSYKDGFLMIYQGYLLMEAVAPRIAESMPKPQWLHTEAKRLWRKQASTDGNVSTFQKQFSEHLTDMDVPHELELQTEDHALTLDIGLRDARIAFECDGPSHYCVNPGAGLVPLARNGVRDALLAARGWHVISVPWDDWEAHADHGACQEWIRRSSRTFDIVSLVK